MNEQLILFETAKLAKEKGFDNMEPNIFGDNMAYSFIDGQLVAAHKGNVVIGYVLAPTQSLLQKWLREKHKIEVAIYCNASGWMWELNKAFNIDWFSGGTHITWSKEDGPNNAGEWDTYEEALEAGLKAALGRI